MSAHDKLKVFISSRMAELRDVREIVAKALAAAGIHAWVYEEDAGARPDGVVATSLAEVENANVYVGLFWRSYGEVTGQEYQYARKLGKPCFVYIRDKDLLRDAELEQFLKAEVYDLQRGVTYDYFDSALALGEQVAADIMGWLMRRHREMTAEIAQARVSQDEIARLQAQVDRLQAASSAQLPQGSPADYLARQMRAWFTTLNYRFERHETRGADFFEWIVEVPARRGYDRILVRGVEGVAELSDLAALRRAIDEQRAAEGWLVTLRRVSSAARAEADKKENRDLFCYTFDELLDERADFTGYLDWLEAEITRREIDRMYIPLACTREEIDPASRRVLGKSRYDERNGWIDGYIDRWLDDPAKEHISVLGEFGSGKTWFALHYAWTALQRYRDAKARGIERPRLPLVIPLRDYAKAVSVESLFSEFFFRKYEIPLPGYSAFEQLNRMGKLLLIFDGFDEMAAQIDRQQMINNFWELARVVVPGAKAILTCRTEHFPEAREGRALLNAELRASTATLSGEPPQFEVLDLEKFDDDQIRQLLSFRARPATVEQVMGNPELLDLARRPVMADLILEALPEIEAGKPVDMSRVYLYAVRRKLERDIKDERTFTSLADKLYFMCELSWEMLSTNQMSLNYRLFPDRLRRLFGPAVQEQKDLDHWHYDMMGQTLLIRNADGDYTPAHRSLLEFFVAYKFAAELGVLADDFVDLARAQSDVDESAAPQEYTWSEYFRRELDENGALKPIAPLQGFVAEDLTRLKETVGEQHFAEVVRDLMRNMLELDEQAIKERLLALIDQTKGKTTEEVGLIGGNALTLLVRRAPSVFRGGDLAGANLSFAEFREADLIGASLRGANLQAARFQNATLENVDMRNADLTNVGFYLREGIDAVDFSPDGKMLASGDEYNVHVWDVATGIKLFTFQVNRYTDGDICWRPNRAEVVVIDNTRGICLWNLNTGDLKYIHHNTESFDMSFSGDGNLLLAGIGRDVYLWDISGEEVKYTKFELCEAEQNASALGAELQSKGEFFVYGSSEGQIKIWDIASDSLVAEAKPYEEMYSLRLSPDERTIIVGAYREGLSLLQTENLTEIWRISDGSNVYNPRFSANGKWVFAGGSRIIAAVVETGLRIGSFATDVEQTGISVSPDDTLLATGGDDGALNFWDARPFVTFDGEPHINMVEYVPPDLSGITNDPASWPEWWQECKIDVPAGMVPNPDFGKRLCTIKQLLPFKGLRLRGAKGLDAPAPQGKGKLRDWLRRRGAITR